MFLVFAVGSSDAKAHFPPRLSAENERHIIPAFFNPHSSRPVLLFVLLGSRRRTSILLVSYRFALTMGDRDHLNDDELDLLFAEPLTSEPDRGMSESDNDSGSNIGSDADDTEDDPDFAFTDESMDESYEDISNVVANEEVFMNESVNNSVNEETVHSVNINVNGEHANNEEYEVLMETADSEEVGVYVSLSEKYKNLNKRGKERMKQDENDKWGVFEGKQMDFVFDGRSEFRFNLPRTAEPVDFFLSYIKEDMLIVMVDETNRNAAQVLAKIRLNRSSRLRKWKPTNVDEMKKFLGLLLYMGLVPMPRLTDYWSRQVLYRNLIAPRVMGRNRFQLLMRFWHFNNNDNMAQEG